MSHAPIALFVFNRPDLAQLTLAALARNEGAAQSDLVIFCDGPKSDSDEACVAATRAVAAAAGGFKSLRLIESSTNKGLANSIITGVSALIAEHGRVIVMEDDIITSPFFLRFMNDALEHYAAEPRVAAISGYTLPLDGPMPETFFLQDSGCWGWATWERAWSKFNPDGAMLLARIRAQKAEHAFNHGGGFVRMLEDQISGKNNSWAIRWRASLFLEGLLSLYPGQSLTRNIGNDGRGTHTGISETFWGDKVAARPIPVRPIPLIENKDAKNATFAFYRKHLRPRLANRIKTRLKRLLYS